MAGWVVALMGKLIGIKKPGAGPGLSKLDDYWLSLSESSPIDLKNFITS